MPNIICAKLAQRKNIQQGRTHGFDYFPFDRIYLIPPDAQAYIPRLFTTYIVMDLTSDLLAALNDMPFQEVFQDSVSRRKSWEAPSPGKSKNMFVGLCSSPEGWALVVPAFLRNRYGTDRNEYYRSELFYILSKVITARHNDRAQLPQMTLHTPHNTFGLMCTGCKNITDFLAGDCTPGTQKCRANADFNLPVDKTNIPKTVFEKRGA